MFNLSPKVRKRHFWRAFQDSSRAAKLRLLNIALASFIRQFYDLFDQDGRKLNAGIFDLLFWYLIYTTWFFQRAANHQKSSLQVWSVYIYISSVRYINSFHTHTHTHINTHRDNIKARIFFPINYLWLCL